MSLDIPLPREIPAWLERPAKSIRLLLGGRAIRVLAVDGLLLFSQLISALMGEGGADTMYTALVLVPLVLFGSILFSETVALERRAGTLELALTARSRFYFEKQILPVLALLALQGVGAMIFARLFVQTFPLGAAIVHVLLVCLLFGSIALFWVLHLRQAGSAMFAIPITFFLLGKWTLKDPISPFGDPYEGWTRATFVGWVGPVLFFLFATILFYGYARRSLARPDRMM